MNQHSSRFLRSSLVVLLLATATAFTACQENATSIGIGYYTDTVSYRTDTIQSSSPILSMHSTLSPTVSVGGRTFNTTWASPLMLVGRAKGGSEDVESWGVIRFRTVGVDTLSKVTAVRLILYTVAYKYGPDSANTNVELQVYAQQGGGTITDSSTSINTSELTTSPVGHFTGSLVDSSGTVVSIPIDSAEIPKLIATSYAFVLEPGTSMNQVRAFATSEGTAATIPVLEYTMRVDTGFVKFTRSAVLDMHVVSDKSVTAPGEFELRGSLGKRLHMDIDLARLEDSLGLTRFSTVNSAVIELHADLANTRTSNLAFDTAGPTLVRLAGTTDTSAVYYGVMSRDPLHSDIYRITCGNLIELWLRDSTTYHGLELRAGSVNRLFLSSYASVDDNTLNRWNFYGTDAVDPTKRPRLYVSHSTLK